MSHYGGSLMIGRVLFGIVADRVPLARTISACLAAGFVAEAASLATIGASVLVLTLALLVLYQGVAWRGRRADVAVGGG